MINYDTSSGVKVRKSPKKLRFQQGAQIDSIFNFKKNEEGKKGDNQSESHKMRNSTGCTN